MPEWTAQEPLASLWRDACPFEWLEREARASAPFRHVDARTTFRFEAHGGSFFAKVHRGVRPAEILKNLLSLRLPVVDARREVRAIERLRSAHVPTLEVVASGVRGWSPIRRRSFVVTRDVGTQTTARDVLRGLGPGDGPLRSKLIRDVARITRRIHEAGVNHRDLYLVHLLVPGSPAQDDPLVLIDLHRAQCHRRVPHRWRHKDLGGLAFDALEFDLSRTDRARFVTAYSGRRLRDALQRGGVDWDAVQRRALRLDAERARKGAAFGR